MGNTEKRNFFHFFMQKKDENIFFTEKSCTFASQLSLGLWCNGNTADSGPAFPGSSPGSPTAESFSLTETLFLFSVVYIQAHQQSLGGYAKSLANLKKKNLISVTPLS